MHLRREGAGRRSRTALAQDNVCKCKRVEAGSVDRHRTRVQYNVYKGTAPAAGRNKLLRLDPEIAVL